MAEHDLDRGGVGDGRLRRLYLRPLRRGHVLRKSLGFGLFQGAMPLIGWVAGRAFHKYFEAFDHWVAFALLTFIGGKMLLEALNHTEERLKGDPTTGWPLIVLCVATSIDAVAVGLSMAVLEQESLRPSIVIAVVTAGLSAAAMWLGQSVGSFWGKRAEVFGGLLLIGIGAKILLEHLGHL